MDGFSFKIIYNPAYYFAATNDSLIAVPSFCLQEKWELVEKGILSPKTFFSEVENPSSIYPKSNGLYKINSIGDRKIELSPNQYSPEI